MTVVGNGRVEILCFINNLAGCPIPTIGRDIQVAEQVLIENVFQVLVPQCRECLTQSPITTAGVSRYRSRLIMGVVVKQRITRPTYASGNLGMEHAFAAPVVRALQDKTALMFQ